MSRRADVHYGRIAARLSKSVELALADACLSIAQFRMLAFLSRGRSAATKLAEQLAVSAPSVTALVDGLVARDLVAREPDPKDRRRVLHVLTTKGRSVLRAADAAVDERLTEIVAHLEEPEAVDQAWVGLEMWGDALEARITVRNEATTR